MTPSRAALELAKFIEQTYGLVRKPDSWLPVDDETEHLARLIDEKVGPLVELAWQYEDLSERDDMNVTRAWRPGST